MARPRSEDKRNTLLAAATEVFASKGLTAPTSAITSAAGVAEGTLFVYFKGKDELINTLYEDLKLSLAEAMLADFPKKASVLNQTRHIWSGYVDWGAENPGRMTLLHKIKVWEGLRPEVKDATAARFCELHELIENATKQGLFQDVPRDFIIAMMTTQAETTMHFMKQDPAKAKLYKDKGFEIFWNGVCRHEVTK